jgi:hypothetical protein
MSLRTLAPVGVARRSSCDSTEHAHALGSRSSTWPRCSLSRSRLAPSAREWWGRGAGDDGVQRGREKGTTWRETGTRWGKGASRWAATQLGSVTSTRPRRGHGAAAVEMPLGQLDLGTRGGSAHSKSEAESCVMASGSADRSEWEDE